MKFQVLTLFPEVLRTALNSGVVGQAVSEGTLELSLVNPRDFVHDVHKTVDDRPFGGGDGMVLMAEPLSRALNAWEEKGHVAVMSPQGKLWTDEGARRWSREHRVVTLVCGRYAGVDQRWINAEADEEISVGDYVLSGGEPAAWIVLDSIARFIPGVLGNKSSSEVESFSHGLLEGPCFTRPREWQGQNVPSFLLSGNHRAIERHREGLSWVWTSLKRPDLLVKKTLREKIRGWEMARELLQWDEKDLNACGISLKDLYEALETMKPKEE